MSRAGIGIAAPICALFLSLVMVAASLRDEGGLCIVAQQRLAQLRAQIAEFEQEAQIACSAGVVFAFDRPRPSTPLDEEAASGAASMGGIAAAIAPSVSQSLLAAASTTTTSDGRRRQTSGTATPCTTRRPF